MRKQDAVQQARNTEYPDDTAAPSWCRLIDAMPILWAEQWAATLESTSPRQAVIELINGIIMARNRGRLTFRQASLCLQPLYSHPVATSWPSGELVAIADDANCLQASSLQTIDDNLYYWQEIERSYQRALSEADDTGDPVRR